MDSTQRLAGIESQLDRDERRQRFAALPPSSDATAAMPGTGVSFARFIEDFAMQQQRMISQDDRADGRVISPHPVRPNIHD